MSRRATIVGLCLGLALSGTASAAPITYSLSSTFAGSLDGKPFVNAGTITGVGDTDTVTILQPAAAFNTLTTAFFSIAGVGSGTVTTPLLVFAAANTFGFREADPTTNDLQDVYGNAFQFYDLTTSLGPVVGPTFSGSGLPLATTAGVLRFAAVLPATITVTLTATPEPASISLLGIGATAAVGGLGRHRRARLAKGR